MADFINSGPGFWHDQAIIGGDIIGGVVVDNGTVVSVRNSAGGDAHPGTAVVTGDTLTGVNVTAATTAFIDSTDTPTIQNSAGALPSTGTAVVSAGVLTAVRLPATFSPVGTGTTIAQVSDSTNVANGRSTGTATVASGVLNNVQLPTTAKIIKNGVVYPLSAAPTGTWATSITFTISAAGVITGAVLS